MTTHVIGMFDDPDVARKVIDQLVGAGCRKEDIEILEEAGDDVADELVDRGFAEEKARSYAKAISQGKTVVVARAADEAADRAVAIMERYESSGGGGSKRRTAGEEEIIPEVEEELSVGKRKVTRGGVRVTSEVTETPVEETVRLREEEVDVDRRSVDRELSPEEADKAFKEKTVEMTETGEEAKISKEARVTGEVSLQKRTEEREQKVQDKVRRTEVEVERLEPESRKKK